MKIMKNRFWILGMALALSLNIFAQNKSGVNWDPKNWMSHLPDNALVCQLSIPGAHDAATGEGWGGLAGTFAGPANSTAQDVKMSVMYDAGVRAFDIRPSWESNTLYNSHGATRTNKKVEDTLDDMIAFLNAHPTEFFVFHIYKGGTWRADKFAELLNKPKYAGRISDFRNTLTVGEMRGKLLFLSRHDHEGTPWPGGYLRNWNEWGYTDYRGCFINAGGRDDYGYNTGAAPLHVQDFSGPVNAGDVEREVDAMLRLLDFTTHHTVALPSQAIWTFNFASGYSKESSLGVSLSDGYRNNATYTNKAIVDYLQAEDYVPGPTGIILADFLCEHTTNFRESKYADNGNVVYGDDLVKELIDNNFRCREDQLVMTTQGTSGKLKFGDSPLFAGNPEKGNVEPGTNELMPMHRGYPIWGDFNGDGKMDFYYSGTSYSHGWQSYGVLVNNLGGNNLSLSYENNGLPKAAFMMGSVTLDVDQDGDLDFLCLNRGSNDTWHNDYFTGEETTQGGLLLVRNNGDGTFTVVPDETLRNLNYFQDKDNDNVIIWAEGRCATILNVADYDLDGYPDLVVQGIPMQGRGFVKVLHNRQGQGFELAQDFPQAPWSGGVTLTDLNADGWPDLAVTGWGDTGGPELRFYRGTGMVGTPFVEITDDVARASGWKNTLDMHRAWGAHQSGLLGMDYNQDGRMDIYVNGSHWQDNSKLSVALINETEPGASTFRFHEMASGLSNFSCSSDRLFTFVDLNGDDYVDGLQQGWTSEIRDWRYAVSESTGKLNVYYNRYFSNDEEGNSLLGGTWQEGCMSVGDFTGDGLPDLASIGYTSRERAEVYKNMSSALMLTRTPAKPTNVKALRDVEGNITVSWDASKLSMSKGAPMYNIILVDKQTGRTVRSLVPALQSGKQLGYASFSSYFVSPEARPSYVLRNVPQGQYEVGVQAVNYGYNASSFVIADVVTNPDVLIDGEINVADVTALVNVILGKGTGKEGITDINGDGQVDVADVTALVNYILGK